MYNVNTICLRYIVPFRYPGKLEEAVKKVESQIDDVKNQPITMWQRCLATTDGPESDLYSYIRNEFCFDKADEPVSDKKSGCAWLFWKSSEAGTGNGQKIKELLYFPDGLNKNTTNLPKPWKIDITNLGLMLFRTGLGFVWYELQLPVDNGDINSQQLKIFQNAVKEYSRRTGTVFWEQTSQEPRFGIVTKNFNEHKTYITPFSMGTWLTEQIDFLEIDYFAKRKNSYISFWKNSKRAASGLESHEIVDDGSIDSLKKGEGEDCPFLPDKSILFSYVTLMQGEKPQKTDDKLAEVYHLTNGYKDSYHFSEELKQEMKQPFDNAFWYATQEGASYVVWPEEDNAAFFNNNLPVKIRGDYFKLFIKALHQSYSLLMYAEKIQSEISAVEKEYLTEPLNERITDLFGEINLFLTKSMATSVSHIHHQSDFYVYLKKQLRLEEDVWSVTSGMKALDILQREQRKRREAEDQERAWKAEKERDEKEKEAREEQEKREKKRDRKLQAIMGLFALLGISSAFADTYGFITGVQEFYGWSINVKMTVGFFLLIVLVIGIIAIGVSVKALIDAYLKGDE